MKRLTLIAAVCVIACVGRAQAADSLLLTWNHHTLTNPLTQTIVTSKGTVTLTNTPTTFYVYRSIDLTNWAVVGIVFHTNRFLYIHSGAPQQIYFAATASNSFAGETPFSPKIAGTAYLFSGANDLDLKKQ